MQVNLTWRLSGHQNTVLCVSTFSHLAFTGSTDATARWNKVRISNHKFRMVYSDWCFLKVFLLLFPSLGCGISILAHRFSRWLATPKEWRLFFYINQIQFSIGYELFIWDVIRNCNKKLIVIYLKQTVYSWLLKAWHLYFRSLAHLCCQLPLVLLRHGTAL